MHKALQASSLLTVVLVQRSISIPPSVLRAQYPFTLVYVVEISFESVAVVEGVDGVVYAVSSYSFGVVFFRKKT